MEVLFTRRFRFLERRFGVLHQFIRLLAVLWIACMTAFDCGDNLMSIDIERWIEYAREIMLQYSILVLRALGQGAYADKGPAAEMRKLLRVGKVSLEPVGHALQESIARVASVSIVDDAQVFNIEHRHCEPRQTLGPALEQAA